VNQGSGINIADIDATYVPISLFADWLSSAELRVAMIEATSEEFSEAIANAAMANRDRTLQDVIQAAALETGAIEGLYRPATGVTLSLIEGAISVQQALEEVAEGSSREEALIAGQRASYELALDIATRAQPLSEAVVSEIHRVACAGQDSFRVRTAVGWQDQQLKQGSYKEWPNHVVVPDGAVHAYCPVDLVPSEMHRLVSEASTDVYAESHPVIQAAYLHHGLTHIHPFSDGNGRVARVLGSVPLLRQWGTPLVVLADRDPQYRAAQSLADRGNFRPFISLLEEMVVDLLQLVAVRLRASSEPTSELETIGRLIARQTSDDDGRWAAATRLEGLTKEILAEKLRKLNLPPNIRGRVHVGSGGGSAPGYRALNDLIFGTLEVDAVVPPVRADIKFKIGVAIEADEGRQLTVSSNGDHQHARTNEIMPRPTQALRARLDSWIDLHVQRLLPLLERNLRR